MKTPPQAASLVRIRSSFQSLATAAFKARIEALRGKARVEQARRQMAQMQEQHGWKN